MKFLFKSCLVFGVMYVAEGCSPRIASTSVDVRKDSTHIQVKETLRDSSISLPSEHVSLQLPLQVEAGKIMDLPQVKKTSGRTSLSVAVKNGEVLASGDVDSTTLRMQVRDIMSREFTTHSDTSSKVIEVPKPFAPWYYKYPAYFGILCAIVLFAFVFYRLGKFTIKPV